MKTDFKKSIANIKILLSIVLIVAILFLILAEPIKIALAAETSSGSDVLDDLSADTKFSVDNYPSNQEDYGLQIITVAESKDKELLLYVYQPATERDFRANYISMSTTLNNSINPNIYSLTYCNHSGTLYKYKVNDFVVSSDGVRFYEIYSIFRPYVEGIDESSALDQTVNAVSFSVSKSWELGEINGNPYIDCVEIETIEITDKFVGFVRYPDGFKFHITGACDSHFVAFDTDKPIDKLFEAEVFFSTQSISETWGYSENVYYGEKKYDNALPLSTEKVDYQGGGIASAKYTWERIQTIDDFTSSVNFNENVYSGAMIDISVASHITEDAQQALKKQKWVLRFYETSFENTSHGSFGTLNYTIVGDVTILRLKFETAGKVYNLGVIDNMQTGSRDPINVTETIVELTETLKLILGIIGIILLAVIVVALAVVVKPIGAVFKFIFKLIWAIISAPFRFIAWLFGGDKK